jgi:hypothetical protein
MRRRMSTGSCTTWRLDDARSATPHRHLPVRNGAEKGRKRQTGGCGPIRRLERPTPKPSISRAFRSGETRTRTGDTTIFRESSGPVRRHKRPANAQIVACVLSSGCPRFRAIPRGFGTPLAPQSPNRQKAADQGHSLLAPIACRKARRQVVACQPRLKAVGNQQAGLRANASLRSASIPSPRHP